MPSSIRWTSRARPTSRPCGFPAPRPAASEGKARVHGPAALGGFLAALGIEARAAALKARASPAQAEEIDRALARLTEKGPKGMGELFKVLAVTNPNLEAVPGLPAPPSTV
jgi:SAM-dependent MidA family methyltransferase